MLTRFSTRDRQRVAYDVADRISTTVTPPPDASLTLPAPPADAGTVLVLHDLLAHRAAMAALRDRLAMSARVVSVDLRGHGASATISGAAITLRELARDVAAVLDQEGLHRAVVVGHGLGAAVARALAADRPDLVAAIVAITTPTHAVDGSPLAETDRRAADLSYKGVADAALDAYLAPRLGPAWRDALPRPALAAIRRHAPALALLIPALAAEPNPPLAGFPTVVIPADPTHLDPSPTVLTAAAEAVFELLVRSRT